MTFPQNPLSEMSRHLSEANTELVRVRYELGQEKERTAALESLVRALCEDVVYDGYMDQLMCIHCGPPDDEWIDGPFPHSTDCPVRKAQELLGEQK
jgi:hypothetical protein